MDSVSEDDTTRTTTLEEFDPELMSINPVAGGIPVIQYDGMGLSFQLPSISTNFGFNIAPTETTSSNLRHLYPTILDPSHPLFPRASIFGDPIRSETSHVQYGLMVYDNRRITNVVPVSLLVGDQHLSPSNEPVNSPRSKPHKPINILVNEFPYTHDLLVNHPKDKPRLITRADRWKYEKNPVERLTSTDILAIGREFRRHANSPHRDYLDKCLNDKTWLDEHIYCYKNDNLRTRSICYLKLRAALAGVNFNDCSSRGFDKPKLIGMIYAIENFDKSHNDYYWSSVRDNTDEQSMRILEGILCYYEFDPIYTCLVRYESYICLQKNKNTGCHLPELFLNYNIALLKERYKDRVARYYEIAAIPRPRRKLIFGTTDTYTIYTKYPTSIPLEQLNNLNTDFLKKKLGAILVDNEDLTEYGGVAACMVLNEQGAVLSELDVNTPDTILQHVEGVKKTWSRSEYISFLSSSSFFFIPLQPERCVNYGQDAITGEDYDDPNQFTVAFRSEGIDSLASDSTNPHGLQSRLYTLTELTQAFLDTKFAFYKPEDLKQYFIDKNIVDLYRMLFKIFSSEKKPNKYQDQWDAFKVAVESILQLRDSETLIMEEIKGNEEYKKCLIAIFESGMYSRRWSGPGYPYPLTFAVATGLDHESEKRALEKIYEVNEFIIQHPVFGALKIKTDALQTEDGIVNHVQFQNLQQYFRLLITRELCIKVASKISIITAEYYLKELFEYDVGVTYKDVDEVYE